jgi:hypothetical protein
MSWPTALLWGTATATLLPALGSVLSARTRGAVPLACQSGPTAVRYG